MNASICVITLLPTSPLTCQAISPAKLSHAFLALGSASPSGTFPVGHSLYMSLLTDKMAEVFTSFSQFTYWVGGLSSPYQSSPLKGP